MSDRWQFEKKYCVCCDTHLATVPSRHYLFADEGQQNLEIPNLLNYFLNIEISKEDHEDAAICGICLENLLNYQTGILPNDDTNLIENHVNVENFPLNHNAKLPNHSNKPLFDECYNDNGLTIEYENADELKNDNTNLIENHMNVENLQLKHNANLPNHSNLVPKLVDECYNGLVLEYKNIDDLKNDTFYDNLIEEDYKISDNDEDDNEKIANEYDNITKISINDCDKKEIEMDNIAETSNDCDNNDIKIYETSFIDSIHKMSIKKRLIYGIPFHSVNVNLDDKHNYINLKAVENIYTSEYLTKNFEDAGKEIDSNEIFDYDQYFASIINVLYDDLQQFPSKVFCALCKSIGKELKNIKELHNHIFTCHTKRGTNFMCILDHLCGSFDSVKALNNHLFVMHSNVIKPKISLTCETCSENFSTAVEFGKHVCFIDPLMLADTNAKTFRCRTCPRILLSHKRFVFHQQFHLPSCRPKVCIICEQLFIDDMQYYEHVQFTHELIAEYSCKLCDSSFSKETEMIEHYSLNHAIYRSKKCKQSLNEHNASKDPKLILRDRRTEEYNKHIHVIWKNDYQEFACHTCDTCYTTQRAARMHIRAKHLKEQNFKCEICDKLFFQKQDIKFHLNEHVQFTNELIAEHSCKLCDKSFSNETEMIEHHHLNHAINKSINKSISCADCKKKFSTNFSLKRHHCYKKKSRLQDKRESVRKRQRTKGDNVTKKSRSIKSKRRTKECVKQEEHKLLRKQKRSKTNNVTKESRLIKRKRKTEECDKQDEHESVRKQQRAKGYSVTKESKIILRERRTKEYNKHIHVVWKNDYQAFACHTCDTCYTTQRAARVHIRARHLKEQHFKCDVCDKLFFQKQDVILHLATIHSNEKKFSCEHCPYKSNAERSLKLHGIRHLKNTNLKLQCKHCFLFFNKNDLKAHNAMKHISDLFQCKVCKKGNKTLLMAKYCCKNLTIL